MKTFLVVTVLKNDLGVYTSRVTLDSRYPLSVELENTLKFLNNKYNHLGLIDQVLLVADTKVYASWAFGEWCSEEHGFIS